MRRRGLAVAVLAADAAGCAIGAAVLAGAPALWRSTGLPPRGRGAAVAALAASAAALGIAARQPTAARLRAAAALNGAWTGAAALGLTSARLTPMGMALTGAVGILDLGMGLAQAALSSEGE